MIQKRSYLIQTKINLFGSQMVMSLTWIQKTEKEGERKRETFSLRTAQGLSCSLENFDLPCACSPTQLPPFCTRVVQLYCSQWFKVRRGSVCIPKWCLLTALETFAFDFCIVLLGNKALLEDYWSMFYEKIQLYCTKFSMFN